MKEIEKFTDQQIADYLGQLDGWEYVDGAIETTFEFKNKSDLCCVAVMPHSRKPLSNLF